MLGNLLIFYKLRQIVHIPKAAFDASGDCRAQKRSKKPVQVLRGWEYSNKGT